jgi:hypothetical protein
MSGVNVLVSIGTRRCLESNAKGEVYTRGCENGKFNDNQKWKVVPSYEGWVKLENVATGRYLDSNSDGKIYTSAANEGDYQKWRI